MFDGILEYGLFDFENLNEIYSRVSKATKYYSLLFSEPNKSKIWVATVQSGYDYRLCTGRVGLLKERENGMYYWSTFEAAIESDPDMIFVITWNEWREHSYIEPSELFGGIYLLITKIFSYRWKK